MSRLCWPRPPRRRFRLLGLPLGCAAFLGLCGCTTMQAVDRESAARTVEPGDTIFVTADDGRELELVFTDWTSEALTGADELGILQKIENEDIARVEVERTSVAKSVGLGALVLGVIGAAAAAGDGGSY